MTGQETRVIAKASSVSGKDDAVAFRCFVILCASMFVNLVMAFANAHGLHASSGSVTVIQALVTAFAFPALFSGAGELNSQSLAALIIIFAFLIINNIANPFNIKTFYDMFLIPIYISLGACAVRVRSRWMNHLLLFVFIITMMEILAPSIYTSLFDPSGYYNATRVWVESATPNDASLDGFYAGAYRAGGSKFSFTDHRVSGPFLEPISLGYFAFLMSTYYAGVDRQKIAIRLAGIFVCLCLALSADSRIPTMLIVVSSLFLLLRWRLADMVIWIIFPLAMVLGGVIYAVQPGFLYGDTFDRMAITFDTLSSIGLWHVMIGMVPLRQVADSGIVYLIRCVGPFGALVAIWYFSGCYTRRANSQVAFFVMISLYLAVSLMFGGATLSIKTASLLGYLVGLVGGLGGTKSASGHNRLSRIP